MRVEVRDTPFDPWAELADYQSVHLRSGAFGATAVFVGTMRDLNEGDRVESMVLEHYPEMTEAHLRRLAGDALERFGLEDILILHRVGEVRPGDPIVLVGVWSAHRAAAFEACRTVMEDLKHSAPFWKKEQSETGERWVERNTPGTLTPSSD